MRKIKEIISKIKWWLNYRFNPRHKYTYHKLTTLSPGYYDTDILILHFTFEIFAKFMKIQLSEDSRINWEYSKETYPDWMWNENYKELSKEVEERNRLWKEMNKLYHWWTELYPNRESTLPELPDLPKDWDFLDLFSDECNDHPVMIEWDRVSKIRMEIEEKWIEEDTKNLIRLVKIRRYLWD